MRQVSPSCTQRLLGHMHRLTGRATAPRELLVLAGYDDFLTKRDLRYLLGRYRQVVLLPRRGTDALLLEQTVQAVWRGHFAADLVSNPGYDHALGIDWRTLTPTSPRLRYLAVPDFCERVLRKVYVPASAAERNGRLGSPVRLRPAARVLKRGIDLLLGLLLLLPAVLIAALGTGVVRRQSPGPLLYPQRRVGQAGREFTCWKFRSMHPDAEAAGAAFARRVDPRTFPFGAWLRAARLDELPQVLNVLRGELSLVGPRPERRVFTNWFEEAVPHYAQRYAARPGLTGYAQVRYGYGAGRQGARHKLMYDLYYLHRWSVTLEIRILLDTVRTVLRGGGH
jgi:lipopolysaccharide/colanic/teichoic acid biosynthesis glycosyltransferase